MEDSYEAKEKFLIQWEKNHPKPEEKNKLREWEKQREDALAHWSITWEAEKKESERVTEKENERRRVIRHINNHILEEQYQMNVVQDMCFLPGVKPYSPEQFETMPVISGMSVFAALAWLENFEQMGELAEAMGNAVRDNLPLEECDQIWKEMVALHKETYVKMRRESQCGRTEEMADLVKHAMQGLVKAALTPDWNYNRLIRFAGEQMVRTFYMTDDAKDPELRSFKNAFQACDTEHVMQSFQALRRMTELASLYHRCVEKLKDNACKNDYFTAQELRDFLIGSYVSNELKKSYEQKKLTTEAIQFGNIRTITNASGGVEVIYGDEKLYQEMKQSESYRKLTRMKIGEIRKMLKKEAEAETRHQQEKTPVQQKDRVMVLKPQKYD